MRPAAPLASGAVLHEVKNARFARRFTRFLLLAGDAPFGTVRRRDLRAQAVHPVALARCDGRTYWAFEQRLYWEDAGLSGEDVLALVRDRQRRAQRTLERAHAALAGDAAERRREPIPRAVRLAVFERDGGRCVECGSGFDIQYDHVIPVALGGANTAANLQILCAPCNQAKGATLG
jgi:5-methylcytosine-specific restriction endonuclease McrA